MSSASRPSSTRSSRARGSSPRRPPGSWQPTAAARRSACSVPPSGRWRVSVPGSPRARPATPAGAEVANPGTPTSSSSGSSPSADSGLDAGLEFGPSNTLFDTYLGIDAAQQDVTLLGERPAGAEGSETQFDTFTLSGISMS